MNEGSLVGCVNVCFLTSAGLQVKRLTSYYKFSCESQCNPTDPVYYVWYKNEEAVWRQTSKLYSGSIYRTDSVSCAVQRLEAFPSPPECELTPSTRLVLCFMFMRPANNPDVCSGASTQYTCNRVTYPERNICAFKGSSVNISCLYDTTTSVSWFTSERGQRKANVHPDYGRVQVSTNVGKRSTLRINNLKESDSATYHCQLSSRSSTRKSSFPGTTLTVTGSEEPWQLLIFLVLLVCFHWIKSGFQSICWFCLHVHRP